MPPLSYHRPPYQKAGPARTPFTAIPLSLRCSVPYNMNMTETLTRHGSPPSDNVEREVLHKNYQSGTIAAIGRIIERRRQERGSNFLDLLRKARLYYGRAPYDIGAIFLGRITARLTRSPRSPLRAV